MLEDAKPIVDAAVDLHDVQPLVDQRDRRQEALAQEPVGPQAIRRVIRGHHEHDAVREQRREQTAQDHRVGDVRDMELVEADETMALRDPRSDERERILFVFQRRELFVDRAHEDMEMDARLAAYCD